MSRVLLSWLKKDDYIKENLFGKAKSIRTTNYKAIDKLGKIVQDGKFSKSLYFDNLIF